MAKILEFKKTEKAPKYATGAGLAQLARAARCQRAGRRFEPDNPLHLRNFRKWLPPVHEIPDPKKYPSFELRKDEFVHPMHSGSRYNFLIEDLPPELYEKFKNMSPTSHWMIPGHLRRTIRESTPEYLQAQALAEASSKARVEQWRRERQKSKFKVVSL